MSYGLFKVGNYSPIFTQSALSGVSYARSGFLNTEKILGLGYWPVSRRQKESTRRNELDILRRRTQRCSGATAIRYFPLLARRYLHKSRFVRAVKIRVFRLGYRRLLFGNVVSYQVLPKLWTD